MEKTNFIDYIRIFCKSGHGGAGSKHFMRNKLTAFGGPDGGDGGRGAHIILRGNKNLWTLLHLRYFKNEQPLGTPENWNEAIRNANGAWIKIMHNDDWFATDNALQVFYNKIQQSV